MAVLRGPCNCAMQKCKAPLHKNHCKFSGQRTIWRLELRNTVDQSEKENKMKSVFKSIQQRRAHNRACRELNNLSDRELADLGIFRADIPSVVAGNRRLD